MTKQSLSGFAIIVVEDDYFIATDLERALVDAGARVIGPFGRIGEVRAALQGGRPAAAAVLDVNIAGAMIFPLAEELREAGIPFIFATGYDERTIPAAFATVPRLVKPIDYRRLVSLLGRVLCAQ